MISKYGQKLKADAGTSAWASCVKRLDIEVHRSMEEKRKRFASNHRTLYNRTLVVTSAGCNERQCIIIDAENEY